MSLDHRLPGRGASRASSRTTRYEVINIERTSPRTPRQHHRRRATTGTPVVRPAPLRRRQNRDGEPDHARPSSTTPSTTRTRPRRGMKHTATLQRRRRAPRRHRQLPPARASRPSSTSRTPRRRRSACAATSPGSSPTATRKVLPYYQRYFLGGETADPRLQHPHRRPHRLERPRPRREQVRALQRRVLLRRLRAPALPALLRRRPGLPRGRDASTLKDLRTSTGAELRFIMPVLNVPFRLIYAFNPNRDSLPARKSTFKFAVGTTF